MIIYFDTETTGLYPGKICQLSYIIQKGDVTTAKNFFFAVDNVDYCAYLVHGFSVPLLYKLSNGQVFSDCIDEIEKDFESADLTVSHNTAFDFMFMRKEFERCGRCFPCKREYCSMKNTVAICKLPKNRGLGYKYPKVNELCEKMGVTDCEIRQSTKELFGDSNGFHDARFDTTAIFLAMNFAMEREENIKEIKSYL